MPTSGLHSFFSAPSGSSSEAQDPSQPGPARPGPAWPQRLRVPPPPSAPAATCRPPSRAGPTPPRLPSAHQAACSPPSGRQRAAACRPGPSHLLGDPASPGRAPGTGRAERGSGGRSVAPAQAPHTQPARPLSRRAGASPTGAELPGPPRGALRERNSGRPHTHPPLLPRRCLPHSPSSLQGAAILDAQHLPLA